MVVSDDAKKADEKTNEANEEVDEVDVEKSHSVVCDEVTEVVVETKELLDTSETMSCDETYAEKQKSYAEKTV